MAMPKAVVEALAAHLLDFPVTNREALLFPGRDGGQLAQVPSTDFPPEPSAAVDVSTARSRSAS